VEHRLVQHLVVWHGARPRIISMSAEALGDGAEGSPWRGARCRRPRAGGPGWQIGSAEHGPPFETCVGSPPSGSRGYCTCPTSRRTGA
jgi:hypothetical protein